MDRIEAAAEAEDWHKSSRCRFSDESPKIRRSPCQEIYRRRDNGNVFAGFGKPSSRKLRSSPLKKGLRKGVQWVRTRAFTPFINCVNRLQDLLYALNALAVPA